MKLCKYESLIRSIESVTQLVEYTPDKRNVSSSNLLRLIILKNLKLMTSIKQIIHSIFLYLSHFLSNVSFSEDTKNSRKIQSILEIQSDGTNIVIENVDYTWMVESIVREHINSILIGVLLGIMIGCIFYNCATPYLNAPSMYKLMQQVLLGVDIEEEIFNAVVEWLGDENPQYNEKISELIKAILPFVVFRVLKESYFYLNPFCIFMPGFDKFP